MRAASKGQTASIATRGSSQLGALPLDEHDARLCALVGLLRAEPWASHVQLRQPTMFDLNNGERRTCRRVAQKLVGITLTKAAEPPDRVVPPFVDGEALAIFRIKAPPNKVSKALLLPRFPVVAF